MPSGSLGSLRRTQRAPEATNASLLAPERTNVLCVLQCRPAGAAGQGREIMTTSTRIAKLEAQFDRGLITAAEFASELMHLATLKAKELTTTFTVTLMVDGHKAGGSTKAPLDEVATLAECECCEPYLDSVGKDCEFGCTSLRFMEDLKEFGQAMIVNRTSYGVSVLTAYVNK